MDLAAELAGWVCGRAVSGRKGVLEPLPHCTLGPGLADTVWWWKASVGTAPTSTAWSNYCRRR